MNVSFCWSWMSSLIFFVKEQCLHYCFLRVKYVSPVIVNVFSCAYRAPEIIKIIKNTTLLVVFPANTVRLQKRKWHKCATTQYHCINKVLIKFMQMVVFSWGRYIDVYHYEYEIVNCGFWNFRRHFECAIYLMTKFILIELCQAFRMTKTAGQSGTLSPEGEKKTTKQNTTLLTSVWIQHFPCFSTVW